MSRLLLAALVVIGMAFSTGAAAISCLSKSEAKHKWPDSHLYWHGENRCWDNRRHVDAALYDSARRQLDKRPTVKSESDRIGPNRTEMTNITIAPDEPVPPPKRPTIIYPEVIKAYASSYWLRPQLIHTWPRLIDTDVNAKFGPWLNRVSGAFGGQVTRIEH